MRVCHVEAGLRSHNIFNPFPEEIGRMLTSRCCTIHFAPGYEAVANLSKAHGIVIDTKHNTLIDSLEYSCSISSETDFSSFFNKKFLYLLFINRKI